MALSENRIPQTSPNPMDYHHFPPQKKGHEVALPNFRISQFRVSLKMGAIDGIRGAGFSVSSRMMWLTRFCGM